MWRWGIAVLCLSGCNGLFEANPSFTESDGSSSTGVAMGDLDTSMPTTSTTPTTSAVASTSVDLSSSGAGETASLECGVDIYEDNDEQGSFVLGELQADGPFSLEAQVDDTADEDWFKVNLAPTGAQRPEPSISLQAELDVEVCVFVRCAQGDEDVECGEYQPATTNANPGANPGCCATGDVGLSYDCVGSIDLDGSAYVRIRAVEPIGECLPYAATVFDASL